MLTCKAVMRNLAILLILITSLGCSNTVATPTFTATSTALYTPVYTASVTSTPVVTGTMTPTVTPTATLTPYPTCLPTATLAPTATPIVGDIIVRACLVDQGLEDRWGNRMCDQPIVPISATVACIYQKTPPDITSMTTGTAGAFVLNNMPAGYYVCLMTDYNDPNPGYPWACRIPFHDNPETCVFSQGERCEMTLMFWTASNCPGPTGTPTATVTSIVAYTATPTGATTPVSHACPNYQVNCRSGTTCPVGTALDTLGSCGVGFQCCVPVTPTATP